MVKGSSHRGTAQQKTTNSSTALLVLGMHRSGTSALTRLLSFAGASLPHSMIASTAGNNTGHWESQELVLTNERILESVGLSWFDWSPLQWHKLTILERKIIQADLKRVLKAEFGDQELLVIKDPRICRLATPYLFALEELNYNVVPILAYRHPLEVARSLQARDSWPEGRTQIDAMMLWLEHTLEAEEATRDLQRVFVSYDRTLSDWEGILTDIERYGKIKLPQEPESIRRAVENFLNLAERHHQINGKELESTPTMMEWVRIVYEALRELEADPASSNAQTRIDEVRNQINAAVPVLVNAIKQRNNALETAARNEVEQRLTEVSTALDAAQREAEELSAVAGAETAARNEVEQRLTEVSTALDAAQREAEELSAVAGAETAARNEVEQRLTEVSTALDAAQREAEELSAVAGAETAARNEVEQRLTEVSTALDAAQREAEELSAVAEAETAEIKADMQSERDALKQYFEEKFARSDAMFNGILEAQARDFRSSRSWRMTAPFRGLGRAFRVIPDNIFKIKSAVAMIGGVWPAIGASTRTIRNSGMRGFLTKLGELKANGYHLTTQPTIAASAADYINRMAAKRNKVLLSDWHVSMVRAIRDKKRADPDGPTVGLSIVTYNSSRWLPGFFSSLRQQGFPLSRLNVAIVDHGSQDDTVSLIQEHEGEFGDQYASFTLHFRPNLGFGAGHDYAIRTLIDDFVLVTNVDLRYHHDTLTCALRAAMADRADVAAWELRQCPYEHPKYYDPVTLEAIWNSHACILFRREAYIDVGGYDHKLFMYGEDVELSYRLRGQGWTLRYLPQISVTHFVDLHDTTLRPNQLSGSLAANVLLRYRYGGDEAGQEGERLLDDVLAKEHSPKSRASMINAQRQVIAKKDHFRTVFKPKNTADFPFSGFDYVFARDGATVPIDSSEPAGNQPKVSIITRTFGPKTGILREALAAVLNQSYFNIEHIIVEDRTDFARELVENVAEAYGCNLRYIKSNGKGRSEAGNCGLANANGELILFLDNDDLLFCDHVELLVRTMNTSSDLAAAYALSWDVQTAFDDEGGYREICHSLHPDHRHVFERERLKTTNFIPIQCVLFRRELYDEEGGFHVQIDHLEDWNLWDRYANYGMFVMVPKLTSIYRTPAVASIAESRQAELDAAYKKVKPLNEARREQIVNAGSKLTHLAD
ncbi:MAG: glycosyltransferase [Rhizobiaceae bacterium]|nr:glycosyltransferase [Rhizobiaceae bacterium]